MKRALLLALTIIIIAIVITGIYIYLSSQENKVKIWDTLSVGVNILFALTIISVIYTVIRDNNEPVITIAWLQVLIFLPVVGFILYIMFGINYRKRKMFRNKASLDSEQREEFKQLLIKTSFSNLQDLHIESFKHAPIIKLLYHNNHSFLSLNNQIETYHDGATTNRKIFESIKEAKHHIHLEYFSINNDDTGKELREILLQKAKEGVEIRLIYDAVGSWRLRKSFFKPLLDNGVQAVAFLPVLFPILSSKLNFRNHRKIVIIDGKTGFIGGVNIGDKYMGISKKFGFWRDSHLKLQGSCVYSLQKSFLIDWNFYSDEKIQQQKFFPPHEITNTLPVQFAISGPDSQWENIMQLYFYAITEAKDKIYITTPYLVLNESIITALVTRALGGIDIRIILPQKADHTIVFLGTHSYYEELMQAGVKIYHYTKGFVHSKILLVDDEFVSVGSANMDIRSFKENFEINAIVYDKNYSSKILKQLEIDFSNSQLVDHTKFQERSSWVKGSESIARLVSPLL